MQTMVLVVGGHSGYHFKNELE